MSSLTIAGAQARTFLESNQGKVLYTGRGAVICPAEGNTGTTTDSWYVVDEEGFLEDLAALQADDPGCDLLSVIAARQDVRRYDTYDLIGSVIMYDMVMTDDMDEALRLARGEDVAIVDDLDDLRLALAVCSQSGGNSGLDTFDTVMLEALGRFGVDTASVTLDAKGRVCHFGTYLIDYEPGEVDGNVGLELIDSWLDTEVAHTVESLQNYVERAIIEGSGWYDEYRWAVESDMARAVSEHLARTANRTLPPECHADAELLFDAVRKRIADGVSIDPDAAGLLAGRSPLCVDIRLTEGSEWNTDFSNIRTLMEAQDGAAGIRPETIDEVLENNGLSWLAERMGYPRDAMLTASAPARRGHEFFEELADAPTYGYPAATIVARMTLVDWVRLVDAVERGETAALSGRNLSAGAYDAASGSGTNFGITIDGTIEIPAENVANVCIDHRESSTAQLIGMPGRGLNGYTIQATYDCLPDLWQPASVTVGPQAREVAVRQPQQAASAARRGR